MAWRSPIGRGNRRAMLSSVMRGQHSYRSPLKSVQWKFESSRQDNASTVITSFDTKNDIEVRFAPLPQLARGRRLKPDVCLVQIQNGALFKYRKGKSYLT